MGHLTLGLTLVDVYLRNDWSFGYADIYLHLNESLTYAWRGSIYSWIIVGDMTSGMTRTNASSNLEWARVDIWGPKLEPVDLYSRLIDIQELRRQSTSESLKCSNISLM